MPNTHTPDFTTRVAGIPCGVLVTRVLQVPAQGSRADSDWDAEGWAEVEFELLDRKGYPAPWLERKLDQYARNALETEILNWSRRQ